MGCLAELGAFAEGIVRAEEGVQIAEAVGSQFALIDASFAVGSAYLRKGDVHQAIPVLERGLELCQVANIQLLFPRIASALGAAYALSGRVGEAVPLLEQAVEQAACKRLMFSLSLWVGWLGEAYLLAGRTEAVIPLAKRALKLSCDHKERGNQAWVLRLLGEVRSRQDPPEVQQAETCYHAALARASELGMRPLLAHCHLGLGSCIPDGTLEEARTELSAAIELYPCHGDGVLGDSGG